jgi:iron complex outermembrane receptor protein
MARYCSSRLSPTALAAAALLASLAAQAQDTTLPPVTIIGRSLNSTADVSGFGDIPLSNSPLQARALSTEQLREGGVYTLAGITRFDASVSDAYNAEGYWSNFTVRGFVIDPRANFRRDGLPINAETHLPLANKERIEILKGTSGIQAGTSAPGGLVNLVSKRPDGNFRSASLGWVGRNTWGAAVDLSQRFGEAKAFGLRLNFAHSELDPHTRGLEGRATLAALAGDWRIAPGTVVEAEFEASRKSQRSLAAMSLLGGSVPSAEAFDPRTNLNNQPWSQPVVLDGNTASLRIRHELGAGWEAHAHLGLQRLRTDDRMSFPYGCFSPDPAPGGTYYADRYCPDGSFDLYDFRSENERRNTDALDLGTRGKFTTGPVMHSTAAGVLFTRFKARFQRQAYNFAGTGTIDGNAVVPAAPALTDENTHRDERSTELYLRDAITLSTDTMLWLGLRHNRIGRESIRTDGSRATDNTQVFTTPWVALSYKFMPDALWYASWGQGIESEVTPARSRFTNRGEATTARSRQVETGMKGQSGGVAWTATAFSIERPGFQNIGSNCSSDTVPGGTCTRVKDGKQNHTGLEGDVEWRLPAFAVQASAMLLRARTEGVASNPSLNGKRPTNVAERSARLNLRHDLAALPGLRVTGGLVYEGPRMVLPDNSIRIGGWTRVDLGVRYGTTLAGHTMTLRAGVDNVADRRAWKESPYQFSHAYLYPMAGRRGHASVSVQF